MPTPILRPTSKSPSGAAPSTSFLRLLLDEIRSQDGPTKDTPRPPRPTLRSLQIPLSRFITQPDATGDDIDPSKSPLLFCDSDISSMPSPAEPPTSAVTSASTETTVPSSALTDSTVPSEQSSWVTCPRKRGRSQETARRQHQTKKLRSDSPKRTLAPTIPRSGTPERHDTRRYTSGSPEPPETPSYLRPLHLMDTSDELRHDISIYKNPHGDDWKRNALCRHCFQRRGTFNRIMTHGYEACGREECLDSHYWEPTPGPYY